MNRILPFTLIAGLFAVGGCGKTAAPPQAAAPAAERPNTVTLPAEAKGIRTAEVTLQPVPDYLEIPAKIQPDPARVVRVYAPLGGRLLSLSVRPGDSVRKGQSLAILDSSEVSAARADFVKARADATVKEQAKNRAAMLYENQVLSQKEYEQARADAEAASATLEQTRDRLRVLGVSAEGSSSEFRVVAPHDGVVLDIGAAPGELSKSLDSPAPLCTLADLTSVWVVGELFEKDVQNLSRDAAATVRVTAFPGEEWKGRLAAISYALDPVTRTLKVRVVLPNPGLRLKPEMFASIRLLRPAAQGVVIPNSAVLREGNTAYVFMQSDATHFERRPVTVGHAVDGKVEITAGLKPGEKLVIEGALLLRDAIGTP